MGRVGRRAAGAMRRGAAAGAPAARGQHPLPRTLRASLFRYQPATTPVRKEPAQRRATAAFSIAAAGRESAGSARARASLCRGAARERLAYDYHRSGALCVQLRQRRSRLGRGASPAQTSVARSGGGRLCVRLHPAPPGARRPRAEGQKRLATIPRRAPATPAVAWLLRLVSISRPVIPRHVVRIELEKSCLRM